MQKNFISILIFGGFAYIARAGIEFINPEYWNPKSYIDYLAVILTSLQDILLAAILFTMLKLVPDRRELKKKIWSLTITISAFGSLVSGIGNFLEDAMSFKQVGSFMFTYGGLIGGISLMIVFGFSLTIAELRKRWAWFYLIPLVSVIMFSDFGGFITGAALLILSSIEKRYLFTIEKD